MKIIHCIAGPTASGKSAYAVKLAQSLQSQKGFGGEIINADALQVYAELQILSARPTDAEMQGIPHHMFGHIDPSERYSTGHWLREVDPLIIDILARGKTPILVGGTGLYFKALTQGLAQIPKLPDSAMEQAQSLLDTDGILALRTRADNLDPQATAKVLGNDPQRLLRIVSVALGTGKPLSVWQKETHAVLPAGTWKGMVILPKRENLYDKINARFADMIREGGLAEAKHVLSLGLASDLPAMKAIGLRELAAHLNGEISLDEAIELAMRQTRRFAKRQYTWLRGQMPDWTLI
ncbi:MAG: tRNA (adenosine(37)-N6)-dimethylallyltransferase MiaA [Robiginitomaculum sp.]|nr:tRNA (adenosine(37)-N6)-dimethylallyltransferase MiaA [Robiginitomaculum sp.]